MVKTDPSALQFKIPRKLLVICLTLIGVGIALIAAQIVFPWHAHGAAEHAGNPRLFKSLLLGLLIAVPLGLCGLFFTAVNHVSGAFWSVTLRRLAESYFWFLPVVALLMIAVFFGLGDNYKWVHESDQLLEWKKPWLNPSFFIGRNLAWLVIWGFFGFMFWRISTRQDEDGNVSRTKLLAKLSAGFLVIFGLSYSASSWDLSMSLEPHWFSTMWAVYIFAGMALTMYASFILWIWYLKSKGFYGETLNENHFHDVGKFMFGHTIFWTYIGFSQYMLIWYAHIPEETSFFKTRTDGEWAVVSFLLPVIRFAIPFFMLIKREVKRNINYMAVVASIVIFGQIFDMYWVTYPTLNHDGSFVLFWWQELGPLFLVAGSYVLIVAKALSMKSLIPAKDPRLEECLHWHQ